MWINKINTETLLSSYGNSRVRSLVNSRINTSDHLLPAAPVSSCRASHTSSTSSTFFIVVLVGNTFRFVPHLCFFWRPKSGPYAGAASHSTQSIGTLISSFRACILASLLFISKPTGCEPVSQQHRSKLIRILVLLLIRDNRNIGQKLIWTGWKTS